MDSRRISNQSRRRPGPYPVDLRSLRPQKHVRQDMMNQERYPAVDYDLSFPNQEFSRAYRDAATFSEKFYGMDQLITQSNITPSDYEDLYPLMVFDVSKQ